MAVLGKAIRPGISDLKHVEAQGANVGDYAWGVDGNYYRWDGNGWQREGGGGGGGSGGGFSFDWEKAFQEAVAPGSVLSNYYDQKLQEAQGDTELAKKFIQEDYDRGRRYVETEYDIESTYNQQELTDALRSLGIDVGTETREARGALNQRGVLLGQIPAGADTSRAPESGYAQRWFMDPMRDKQDLRKAAIERAAKRQEDLLAFGKERDVGELGVEKERGLEREDRMFPRTQRELLEEKRMKATQIEVPAKYQAAYSKYIGANAPVNS